MTHFLRSALFFLFILCRIPGLFAQEYDVSIYVYDKMVNKLINSIGKVSSTEEYRLSLLKGTYTWVVDNIIIKFEKGKAAFTADVNVDSGPFTYRDEVNGSIDVNYNAKDDKIELRLTHAYLDIKTKVFGKERLIKTINIADYYTTPFEFDGPLTFSEDFSFEMPDGSMKKIVTAIENFNLEILPKAIRMQANLTFTDASKLKPLTKVEPAPGTKNTQTPIAEDQNAVKSKKEKREEKKKAKEQKKMKG